MSYAILRNIISTIRRQWFLSGIVIVILLAKYAPDIGAKGVIYIIVEGILVDQLEFEWPYWFLAHLSFAQGILKPEITVKYIAVSVIFFNSGISLKSEELGKALLQVKIHLFIQTFTFLFFPVTMFTLASVLGVGAFNANILKGLRILSCMPPPVSSAVILTKAVGGNEAAAIFNSAFGSFLGIAVTPMLILFLVGTTASVPVASIFIQLTATVVIPLLIGQWMRRVLSSIIDIKSVPWGQIGSAVLLLIIYTTFCDTFTHKDIDVDGKTLVLTIILIIIIQCILLYVVFYVTSRRWFTFTRPDTVALMYCCTHKSLTLGIPIIKIIFADSPSMSLITIPLLVYHPTQILLGGVLAPHIRKWMIDTSSSGSSISNI